MTTLPIVSMDAIEEVSKIIKLNPNSTVDKLDDMDENNKLLTTLIKNHIYIAETYMINIGLNYAIIKELKGRMLAATLDIIMCLEQQNLINAQKEVQSKNKTMNN